MNSKDLAYCAYLLRKCIGKAIREVLPQEALKKFYEIKEQNDMRRLRKELKK